MKLSRLQKTTLYLLDYTSKRKHKNLSTFQIMKLIYLIEVESRKFLGKSFMEDDNISFHRYPRGPISYDIYNAIKGLEKSYISVKPVKVAGYTKPRHCHSLKKKVSNRTIGLTKEERVFLNSILDDYLVLSQSQLKKTVYGTRPMRIVLGIEKREGGVIKGSPIPLDSVPLDEEIINIISEE